MTFPRAYGRRSDIGTYIRVKEATTGTTLGSGTGSGTGVVIGFDTVNKNTDPTNFSLTSDVITVAKEGEYRIEYKVCWVVTAAGRRQIRCTIQRDTGGGGGFQNVGATFHYTDMDGTYRQVSHAYTIITMQAGNQIRLHAQRNVGTETTQADKQFMLMTIQRIA